MKNYTIFYSWQSDYDFTKNCKEGENTERNPNETEDNDLSQKDLIQKALECQAYRLKENHGWNITVDFDTDNAPGMQPISDVVIKKIKKCNVFVCDLTPVTSLDDNNGRRKKLIPNPNVMFELGIAISNLQQDQIIAIAHDKNGSYSINELPLDISNRKIHTFNCEKDLNDFLYAELESSLAVFKQFQRGLKSIPFWLTNWFKHPSKESNARKEKAILSNSEIFFNDRISTSFPGIRGLKSVNKDMLNKFFMKPISIFDVSPMVLFDEFIENPINIKQFKNLMKDDIMLIGNTEVKAFGYKNDILVYRNRRNPRIQFLLIMSHRASSVDYDYSINYNQSNKDYRKSDIEVEEYAIYYGNKKEHIITKELYDDGTIFKDGKYISITEKAESRRRYLKDCLIMIVPSKSIFNKIVYNRVNEIFNQVRSQGYHDEINLDSFEEDLNAYFETFVPAENLYNSNQIMNKSTNNNADDKEQRISINHSNGSEGLFKPRKNQRKKKGR